MRSFDGSARFLMQGSASSAEHSGFRILIPQIPCYLQNSKAFSREGEGYGGLFAKRISRSWMRAFFNLKRSAPSPSCD